MLRDFLGSGHCESVFGWVFSLPTPPWLLISTGFPFLRCIQEKDTRVYNVNCNRLLVYFVILFFLLTAVLTCRMPHFPIVLILNPQLESVFNFHLF